MSSGRTDASDRDGRPRRLDRVLAGSGATRQQPRDRRRVPAVRRGARGRRGSPDRWPRAGPPPTRRTDRRSGVRRVEVTRGDGLRHPRATAASRAAAANASVSTHSSLGEKPRTPSRRARIAGRPCRRHRGRPEQRAMPGGSCSRRVRWAFRPQLLDDLLAVESVARGQGEQLHELARLAQAPGCRWDRTTVDLDVEASEQADAYGRQRGTEPGRRCPNWVHVVPPPGGGYSRGSRPTNASTPCIPALLPGGRDRLRLGIGRVDRRVADDQREPDHHAPPRRTSPRRPGTLPPGPTPRRPGRRGSHRRSTRSRTPCS